MPTTLEFSIPQHTMLAEGEFAIMDAIANITTMLTNMNYEYKTDWELQSSYYGHDGDRIVAIKFFNATDAMLATLRGLKQNG